MFEGVQAFGFAYLRGMAIIASLATSFLSGDCLAQTAPSPAVASGVATTAPAAATAPTVQEVTISGNPSLLRVAYPWWGEPESPCSTFRVTAAPSVAALELYTNGLGRSLLAETDTDQGTKCPASMKDRITLTRDKSGAEINRFVSIKVDPKSLTTPGTSMQGVVAALTGTKKGSEFALKVERSPRDEAWTALIWVLTILIPAAVTAAVTYGGTRLATAITARRKQVDDFRTYRLDKMNEIIDFIENDLRPIIGDSGVQHPGRLIRDLLAGGRREFLAKMPEYEVNRLMKAIGAEDVKRIVKMLKRLFPESTQSLEV
jgi:hypothetical protein